MKVDHIVVHIDNDTTVLEKLRREAEECGFPFDPTKGKGTRGFKVSNLWVGEQYFEIPRLTRKDGGGWVPSWVERYNKGNRGAYCIFLKTENLEKIQSELSVRGVLASIERTSYKLLFGLYTMTMPWRYLRLSPIPESDLEIGFYECEEQVSKKMRSRMTPNAADNGIVGISDVDIFLPSLEKALPFLKSLFPQLEQTSATQVKVNLGESELNFHQSPSGRTEVLLEAESKNDTLVGKEFSLHNVTLRTRPARSS